MDFWNWMDNVVGCIPIVGTIKDGVEAAIAGIEGHPKEAREKLIEAGIGLIGDIATVATFGAASELAIAGKAAAEEVFEQAAKGIIEKGVLEHAAQKASIKMAEKGAADAVVALVAREAAIKAQKQLIKKRGGEERPKTPEQRPKKRGDHVINLNVLKCFKSIIDQFIDDNIGFFYGCSFDQMVAQGNVPEESSIFLSHRPFTGPYDREMAAELTTMVVYLDVQSPNDMIYGAGVCHLKILCLGAMTRAFHDLIENQLIDDRVLQEDMGMLDVFIRGQLNEELIPGGHGIYVDTMALNQWLRTGGNMPTFERRRNTVREMFRRLARTDAGPAGYLHEWAQTLYEAHLRMNRQLAHGNHVHRQLGVTLRFQDNKDEDSEVSEKLETGFQNDGAGTLFSAVANTVWGTIPGKAKDDTCWYAYGGKEYSTLNFQWLTSVKPVTSVQNAGFLPVHAIACGFQTDGAGHLYAAVANTPYGTVPGKAKDNTCWYSYGGHEYYTQDFIWLVKSTRVLLEPMVTLVRSPSDMSNAIPFGFQTDGEGTLYCAVAHAEQGDIPGKAKDDRCWYSYGGEEFYTSDFSYLESTVPVYKKQNRGAPPEGALIVGKELDSGEWYFAAIANTQWGNVPGKAKDNTCWYPYGGKEYTTEDFEWVTSTSHSD